MYRQKLLAVTVAVLISLIANTAGVPLLSGYTEPVMAQETEKLVAQSLGLVGATEKEFLEQVDIQQLTGAALDEALSSAQDDEKSQVVLEYLQQQGYQIVDDTASGLTVAVKTEMGYLSATLLLLDYRQPITGQAARFLYVSDSQGQIRVGVGLIEMQNGQVSRLEVLEVGEGELVRESVLMIDENGVLAGEDASAVDLLPDSCGSSLEITLPSTQRIDDCSLCQQICGAVYGGGCSLTSVLFCTLVCAPIGNLACPLICGAVWVLMCVIGTWSGCGVICGSGPGGLGFCP